MPNCSVAVQEIPNLWIKISLQISEPQFYPLALYVAANQAGSLNQVRAYRLQKMNKHPPAIRVTVKQFLKPTWPPTQLCITGSS